MALSVARPGAENSSVDTNIRRIEWNDFPSDVDTTAQAIVNHVTTDVQYRMGLTAAQAEAVVNWTP